MDIFSKIAAGEIPSYKCAESEKFYAFLDINPVAKGHTLVIPRREVDYIFDMDDEELAEYQVFAKRVATALKKAFPCRKVAQVVLGLEVPHAHIHLIPMNSEADVDFRRDKLKLSEEDVVRALEVGNPLSLDTAMTGEGEEAESLYEVVPDGNDDYEDVDTRETLRVAMKDFTDTERALIKYRYEDELSQGETPKRLGVSQMFVSRMERKLLLRLKSRLKDSM